MRVPKLLAMLAASTLAAASLAAQSPASGYRAEFLSQWKSVGDKYVQLAEAMPWDKYSWRPGTGVRSVCEVYLHIAGDNYYMAREMGAKVPAGIDLKTIETCPDSKDRVIATMKDGFAFYRDAVLAGNDADADKPLKVFGMTFTSRGYLMFVMEHAGEHLGQSIAYARTNGIVPPWSLKPGM